MKRFLAHRIFRGQKRFFIPGSPLRACLPNHSHSSQPGSCRKYQCGFVVDARKVRGSWGGILNHSYDIGNSHYCHCEQGCISESAFPDKMPSFDRAISNEISLALRRQIVILAICLPSRAGKARLSIRESV